MAQAEIANVSVHSPEVGPKLGLAGVLGQRHQRRSAFEAFAREGHKVDPASPRRTAAGDRALRRGREASDLAVGKPHGAQAQRPEAQLLGSKGQLVGELGGQVGRGLLDVVAPGTVAHALGQSRVGVDRRTGLAAYVLQVIVARAAVDQTPAVATGEGRRDVVRSEQVLRRTVEVAHRLAAIAERAGGKARADVDLEGLGPRSVLSKEEIELAVLLVANQLVAQPGSQCTVIAVPDDLAVRLACDAAAIAKLADVEAAALLDGPTPDVATAAGTAHGSAAAAGEATLVLPRDANPRSAHILKTLHSSSVLVPDDADCATQIALAASLLVPLRPQPTVTLGQLKSGRLHFTTRPLRAFSLLRSVPLSGSVRQADGDWAVAEAILRK